MQGRERPAGMQGTLLYAKGDQLAARIKAILIEPLLPTESPGGNLVGSTGRSPGLPDASHG